MSRKEPVKPVNDLIRFWNQAANGSNDEPKNPLRQQTMPTENPTGVRQGPLARRSTAPLQSETSSNAKSSQTKTAENSRLTSDATKKSVITNLNDSKTTGNASSSKKTSIGMTTSAPLTNSSDSDNKPEMEPPGTSFSIINIQTLSTKTDKGRMNWSSLPQPASSDPLSSSSTGTSPAIAALEKIRNSTQENVDLFTRRQSVRGPRPPTDQVGTLITKFKSATNSGVTSPKSPDSPTGEQRTHELLSPTSPISIGSFEETVTRAFSSDGAFSPPLSPPGVTDKRGKTSKYFFDKELPPPPSHAHFDSNRFRSSTSTGNHNVTFFGETLQPAFSDSPFADTHDSELDFNPLRFKHNSDFVTKDSNQKEKSNASIRPPSQTVRSPAKAKSNPFRLSFYRDNDIFTSNDDDDVASSRRVSADPFNNYARIDDSEFYKVIVGPKGTDSARTSAQATNSLVLEMNDLNFGTKDFEKDFASTSQFNKTNTADEEVIAGDNTKTRSTRNVSAKHRSMPGLPKSNSRKKENRYTFFSFRNSDSDERENSNKRRLSKKANDKNSWFNLRIPSRAALSPSTALKSDRNLARSALFSNHDHELPEYIDTKSKFSLLVPHSLSSTEYRKANHSLPDFTARHKQRVFTEAYKKYNQSVPHLARIDVSGIYEASRAGGDSTTGEDIDMEKITTFSINPYDESENELFKPGAPWINLPRLDEFIRALPKTEFSDPKEIMTDEEYHYFSNQPKLHCSEMFPPMNLLPDGVPLEDLKQNITKASKVGAQARQNDVVEMAIDGVLAAEGSAYGVRFMQLEMIRDLFQYLALALISIGGSFGNWLYTILFTIPNLLSLNLVDVFGNGFAFLVMLFGICLFALYYFRQMTKWDPNTTTEGYESRVWSLRPESNRRASIAIVFIITTLYLPLSKLSFDALFWSSTFWPPGVPYTHNLDNVEFAPLGPSDIYRDPWDFCYVTSMKKRDLNFAYVIIPVALANLLFLTIWFPIALKRLVDKNLPKVDNFNELGEARHDKKEEYKKMLKHDNCPYNFLYNGYNHKWGAYKTFIMAHKLVNILLIVLITKDNCVFRSYSGTTLSTVRQVLQIVLMVLLLGIHWHNQPFLYESQNMSEYWSRAGYVIISVLGLFYVLAIGSAQVTGILITVITCVVCVAAIFYVLQENTKFRQIVKIMKKRLDFSINIYSPKLDFEKYIKRRVWQETWTTLFLTSEQFKMDEGTVIAFSTSHYRPPYLLNFNDTVAERHIENLKIIRHIGIRQYTVSTAPLPGSLAKLRLRIVDDFVGPDMYYSPEIMNPALKTYFGKAYVVPFPFSVVMVYDEDESVVTLTREWEIERYVKQNSDPEIIRRRRIRYMIRALEGKLVLGPCPNDKKEFEKSLENNGTQAISSSQPVHYHSGVLQIRRCRRSRWQNYNMNPGFIVTISYTNAEWRDSGGIPQTPHERTVGHEVIGITDDFQLTAQLEKFFADNLKILEKGLTHIEDTMLKYREYYRDEGRRKEETLTYAFFVNVYDNPNIPLESMPALLMTTENNDKVQAIPESEFPTLIYLYERMRIVNLSRVHQWWFLFWDDLWRKNSNEIAQLLRRPQDFSPAYRTSICYRPMTRLQLEEFLERRGCWQNGGKSGFLHSGVLNRVYFYLNNVVFNCKNKSLSESGDLSAYQKGGNVVLGRVKWTWKERLTMLKDIVLWRKVNHRSKPFFILQESEYMESDGGLSDNSASDEDNWL